jgi:hypothetical protein
MAVQVAPHSHDVSSSNYSLIRSGDLDGSSDASLAGGAVCWESFYDSCVQLVRIKSPGTDRNYVL